MKITGRNTVNALLVGAACAGVAVIAACNNDSSGPKPNRDVVGPEVSVGNGTARTFVAMNGDTPVSIGIEVSEAAMQNLPQSDTEWELQLPAGVAVAPFDHATLNWNPQGHPPPGVYMVPHFDFHFYTVSSAAQHAVQGGPYTATIPRTYLPQDYAPDPVAVPNMGVHWTDTQAPEFHGQTFERTFIFGSYGGQLAFLEPMVTRAYLQSHPEFTTDVKQPQAYQKSGYYPTKYSVRYDAANSMFRIALDSLAARS